MAPEELGVAQWTFRMGGAHMATNAGSPASANSRIVAFDERFLRPEHRTLLLRERAVEPLLDAMAAWAAPTVPKWL